MRRIFNIFPVWVWVVGLILVASLINALIQPPQRRSTPPLTKAPAPSVSLPDAYIEFKAQVEQVDPLGLVVSDVEQFGGSELLYLTAGSDFLKSDKTAQTEAVISFRDLWKKECGCNPVLVFRTENKQELIKITSTGDPEFVGP